MPRYSAINPFVIFPSVAMEEEWTHKRRRSGCSSEKLAKKLSHVVDNARSEQEVHEFFELHPQALPDVGYYHNGPRGNLVVTKMPLGHDFVTDFAFVSENSQMVQFTCVEIEAPTKQLFNRGAAFSRDYLDARQQLSD